MDYGPPPNIMGQAKRRETDARQAAEAIEQLIDLRLSYPPHMANCPTAETRAHDEKCEVIKRFLTDYFLQTDPRKGVYFDPRK